MLELWKLTDVGIPRALGRHIQTFGPNATKKAYIGLFSCELTYTGIIVFVKFSILALYWRIFNKTNIKIPISILATGVSMWGIAVVSLFFGLKSRIISYSSSFCSLCCNVYQPGDSGIVRLRPLVRSTAKSFCSQFRSQTSSLTLLFSYFLFLTL